MAAKFEIYKDSKSKFRFRLKSANGEIILASAAYTAKSNCKNGIASVRKNAADDARYERKDTKAGKFMFNLKAANSQVIGTSQSYSSAATRNKGIASVRKSAPGARTEDQTI